MEETTQMWTPPTECSKCNSQVISNPKHIPGQDNRPPYICSNVNCFTGAYQTGFYPPKPSNFGASPRRVGNITRAVEMKEAQERKSNTIRPQVALYAAVDLLKHGTIQERDWEKVIKIAETFLDWLESKETEGKGKVNPF